MEHPLREYTRNQFASVFGDGPAVRNAEKSIYNWAVKSIRELGDQASWENKLFRLKYRQKVLNLVAELKRAPMAGLELSVKGDRVNVNIKVAPQLVIRLGRKDLEMRKLATYSPDVLWPEGPWAQTMLKVRERDLLREKAKAAEKDYEGLFKCGRCKSLKTTYYQMQTRSADEPMVRYLAALFLFTFSLTDAFSSTDYLRQLQQLWKPLEVLMGVAVSQVRAFPDGLHTLVLV